MFKKQYDLILSSAQSDDLLFLAVREKESANSTKFVSYYKGEKHYIATVEWNAISLCVPKKPTELMLAVSAKGETFSILGGNKPNHSIPTEERLNRLTVVDGFALTCGEKGVIYKRNNTGNWLNYSIPAEMLNENVIANLKAARGFSLNEIYAVGDGGEIWLRTKDEWSLVNSPTKADLSEIICVNNDKCYIVGKEGTLIIGRENSWKQIKTNITDKFCDLQYFNGRIYVSTENNIYEYSDNELKVIDFNGDKPNSCCKLTSSEKYLWSIGKNDIFNFDGQQWSRIE